MERAKKGDLVVYETRRTDSVRGREPVERVEYRAAKVASAHRDGTVAAIVGGSGQPIEAGVRGRVFGWHRCWVVGADVVRVDDAVIACESNPWPHDASYIHCPFDSLDAIRAVVARYRHSEFLAA